MEEVFEPTQKNQDEVFLKKQQDISKYLLNLKISDDIKLKATEIRSKMSVGCKRGNNLNKLVFYCVYWAFIELNESLIIEDLANTCGINPKDVAKALNAYPSVNTGYFPPTEDKDASEYIPKYFHISRLHTLELEKILTLYRKIAAGAGILDNYKPQDVAVAMIYYYMDINGILTDSGKTSAQSTVNLIKKKLGTLDNASDQSL